MATVKLILRASSRDGHGGTLYFRVIHNRKIKQIHTGFKLNDAEWDEKTGTVIITSDEHRKKYLTEVIAKTSAMRRRLEQTISVLDSQDGEYTSEDVAARYNDNKAIVGLLSFIQSFIIEHRAIGMMSAAAHLRSLHNSLVRFHSNEEIPFDTVDEQFVRNYEAYLKVAGLCPNSTSYYIRKLRRIYNLAVERGLAPERNPFRSAYTGVAKTVKRAIPVDIVKQLKKLDLSDSYCDALARDMFLFSFYTRGMSTVDMAKLKKKDLRDGILTYRRSKTKQSLTIKWEKQMDDIAARYNNPDSPYLLPLIKEPEGDEYRQYLNASHLLNRHLNALGRRLGLSTSLTMYVARHTWASTALSKNVPVSVISQGMGHDSEKTTLIYLATLDRSKVDKANNDIINLLDED